MEISMKDVGDDFYFALKKLVDIRKDKKQIYGDTYLEDTETFLLMQCENKLKRLKLHLQNGTQDNRVEKALDNALDLSIYALFLASKLEEKE